MSSGDGLGAAPSQPISIKPKEPRYGDLNQPNFRRDISSDEGQLWLDSKINFLNEIMKFMPRNVINSLSGQSKSGKIKTQSKGEEFYADSVYNQEIFSTDLWKGKQGEVNIFNQARDNVGTYNTSDFAGMFGLPFDGSLSLATEDGYLLYEKDTVAGYFYKDYEGKEQEYTGKIVPTMGSVSGDSNAKTFREGVNLHPTIVDFQHSALTYSVKDSDFIVDMNGDGYADYDYKLNGNSIDKTTKNLTTSALTVDSFQKDYLDKLDIFMPVTDYSDIYENFMQGSRFSKDMAQKGASASGSKAYTYNNLHDLFNEDHTEDNDFKKFMDKIRFQLNVDEEDLSKTADYIPNIYEIARSGEYFHIDNNLFEKVTVPVDRSSIDAIHIDLWDELHDKGFLDAHNRVTTLFNNNTGFSFEFTDDLATFNTSATLNSILANAQKPINESQSEAVYSALLNAGIIDSSGIIPSTVTEATIDSLSFASQFEGSTAYDMQIKEMIKNAMWSDKDVFYLSMLMLESRRRYSKTLSDVFGVNSSEVDIKELLNGYTYTDGETGGWQYDDKKGALYINVPTLKGSNKRMYNYFIPENIGIEHQQNADIKEAKLNFLRERGFEAEVYKGILKLYQNSFSQAIKKFAGYMDADVVDANIPAASNINTETVAIRGRVGDALKRLIEVQNNVIQKGTTIDSLDLYNREASTVLLELLTWTNQAIKKVDLQTKINEHITDTFYYFNLSDFSPIFSGSGSDFYTKNDEIEEFADLSDEEKLSFARNIQITNLEDFIASYTGTKEPRDLFEQATSESGALVYILKEDLKYSDYEDSGDPVWNTFLDKAFGRDLYTHFKDTPLENITTDFGLTSAEKAQVQTLYNVCNEYFSNTNKNMQEIFCKNIDIGSNNDQLTRFIKKTMDLDNPIYDALYEKPIVTKPSKADTLIEEAKSLIFNLITKNNNPASYGSLIGNANNLYGYLSKAIQNKQAIFKDMKMIDNINQLIYGPVKVANADGSFYTIGYFPEKVEVTASSSTFLTKSHRAEFLDELTDPSEETQSMLDTICNIVNNAGRKSDLKSILFDLSLQVKNPELAILLENKAQKIDFTNDPITSTDLQNIEEILAYSPKPPNSIFAQSSSQVDKSYFDLMLQTQKMSTFYLMQMFSSPLDSKVEDVDDAELDFIKHLADLEDQITTVNDFSLSDLGSLVVGVGDNWIVSEATFTAIEGIDSDAAGEIITELKSQSVIDEDNTIVGQEAVNTLTLTDPNHIYVEQVKAALNEVILSSAGNFSKQDLRGIVKAQLLASGVIDRAGNIKMITKKVARLTGEPDANFTQRVLQGLLNDSSIKYTTATYFYDNEFTDKDAFLAAVSADAKAYWDGTKSALQVTGKMPGPEDDPWTNISQYLTEGGKEKLKKLYDASQDNYESFNLTEEDNYIATKFGETNALAVLNALKRVDIIDADGKIKQIGSDVDSFEKEVSVLGPLSSWADLVKESPFIAMLGSSQFVNLQKVFTANTDIVISTEPATVTAKLNVPTDSSLDAALISVLDSVNAIELPETSLDYLVNKKLLLRSGGQYRVHEDLETIMDNEDLEAFKLKFSSQTDAAADKNNLFGNENMVEKVFEAMLAVYKGLDLRTITAGSKNFDASFKRFFQGSNANSSEASDLKNLIEQGITQEYSQLKTFLFSLNKRLKRIFVDTPSLSNAIAPNLDLISGSKFPPKITNENNNFDYVYKGEDFSDITDSYGLTGAQILTQLFANGIINDSYKIVGGQVPESLAQVPIWDTSIDNAVIGILKAKTTNLETLTEKLNNWLINFNISGQTSFNAFVDDFYNQVFGDMVTNVNISNFLESGKDLKADVVSSLKALVGSTEFKNTLKFMYDNFIQNVPTISGSFILNPDITKNDFIFSQEGADYAEDMNTNDIGLYPLTITEPMLDIDLLNNQKDKIDNTLDFLIKDKWAIDTIDRDYLKLPYETFTKSIFDGKNIFAGTPGSDEHYTYAKDLFNKLRDQNIFTDVEIIGMANDEFSDGTKLNTPAKKLYRYGKLNIEKFSPTQIAAVIQTYIGANPGLFNTADFGGNVEEMAKVIAETLVDADLQLKVWCDGIQNKDITYRKPNFTLFPELFASILRNSVNAGVASEMFFGDISDTESNGDFGRFNAVYTDADSPFNLSGYRQYYDGDNLVTDLTIDMSKVTVYTTEDSSKMFIEDWIRGNSFSGAGGLGNDFTYFSRTANSDATKNLMSEFWTDFVQQKRTDNSDNEVVFTLHDNDNLKSDLLSFYGKSEASLSDFSIYQILYFLKSSYETSANTIYASVEDFNLYRSKIKTILSTDEQQVLKNYYNEYYMKEEFSPLIQSREYNTLDGTAHTYNIDVSEVNNFTSQNSVRNLGLYETNARLLYNNRGTTKQDEVSKFMDFSKMDYLAPTHFNYQRSMYKEKSGEMTDPGNVRSGRKYKLDDYYRREFQDTLRARITEDMVKGVYTDETKALAVYSQLKDLGYLDDEDIITDIFDADDDAMITALIERSTDLNLDDTAKIKGILQVLGKESYADYINVGQGQNLSVLDPLYYTKTTEEEEKEGAYYENRAGLNVWQVHYHQEMLYLYEESVLGYIMSNIWNDINKKQYTREMDEYKERKAKKQAQDIMMQKLAAAAQKKRAYYKKLARRK